MTLKIIPLLRFIMSLSLAAGAFLGLLDGSECWAQSTQNYLGLKGSALNVRPDATTRGNDPFCTLTPRDLFKATDYIRDKNGRIWCEIDLSTVDQCRSDDKSEDGKEFPQKGYVAGWLVEEKTFITPPPRKPQEGSDPRAVAAEECEVPSNKNHILDVIEESTEAIELARPIKMEPCDPPEKPCNCDGVDSEFGHRWHPVYGGMRLHGGIDLDSKMGTPVYAAEDGIVKAVRWGRGYGRQVQIQHVTEEKKFIKGRACGRDILVPLDGFLTTYNHLNGYKDGLKPGDRVKKGEVIAYAGNSGVGTAPHFHFETLVKGGGVNCTNSREYGHYRCNPRKFIDFPSGKHKSWYCHDQ